MTTKPQHTPGPWTVDGEGLYVIAPIERGGNFKICDIRGWGFLTGKGCGALGLSHKEAEKIQIANARLIAAAPEMLEALRYCESLLNEMDRHALITPAMEELVYGKVSSAIRKATEEE